MWFGKNARPRLLFDWWSSGQLTVEDLRALMPDAWQMSEGPQEKLGVAAWVFLFRCAGFISDANHPQPREPLTIYRGATWGRRRGMAWTTDREKAEWFANRFSVLREALVYEITVGPEVVLALFDGRNEAEVVVEPAKLPPVRKPPTARAGLRAGTTEPLHGLVTLTPRRGSYLAGR
jgi:hypothetical protein